MTQMMLIKKEPPESDSQRPEVKTLRVLGNQRLTPGGSVKRAKPRQQVSVKKRSQD